MCWERRMFSVALFCQQGSMKEAHLIFDDKL